MSGILLHDTHNLKRLNQPSKKQGKRGARLVMRKKISHGGAFKGAHQVSDSPSYMAQ